MVRSLWDKDRQLADKLNAMIFRFEDLFRLPERSLRAVVEAAEAEDLVCAMSGADAKLSQAFIRVLPEERRRIFQQHLELGSGEGDAEAAQWRIMKIAKDLQEQGRIRLKKPAAAGAEQKSGR